MANFAHGFYIDVIAPTGGAIEFTTDPFPPGTNVYATISLSQVNTEFEGKDPYPTFAAIAYISWWTVYLPDGSESPKKSRFPGVFEENSIGINNVARINFELLVDRAWAIAQINIFGF